MNTRFKELAEQAGITTNLDTDYYEKDMNKWVDYFSEKFAELIVRECLLKVNEIGDGVYEYDHSVVEKHVHNHFGVEE